jgi:glycerol-3-phosphate acyltransferase PlsY
VGTVFVAVLAFLCGSFPTGILVSQMVSGVDVRHSGSGNFGAANVARAAGLKVGILVAVLDILKGVIPVSIGFWLGLDHVAVALVALLAVFGHDFSIFLRLRGGKGVATTLGVALVLAPPAAAAGMVVWLVVMGIWRYSSLASLALLACLPAGAVVTGQPEATRLLLVALFVLGAIKHWENILRLLTGKESKFQRSRPARDS